MLWYGSYQALFKTSLNIQKYSVELVGLCIFPRLYALSPIIGAFGICGKVHCVHDWTWSQGLERGLWVREQNSRGFVGRSTCC